MIPSIVIININIKVLGNLRKMVKNIVSSDHAATTSPPAAPNHAGGVGGIGIVLGPPVSPAVVPAGPAPAGHAALAAAAAVPAAAAVGAAPVVAPAPAVVPVNPVPPSSTDQEQQRQAIR